MQSPIAPAALPLGSEPGSRTSVYVARQPILDGNGRVYAYELLYRDAADAKTCTNMGDEASARLLTNALLSIGLGTLTEGRPAFCNVTEHLLLTDLEALLPPQLVVLELRDSSRPRQTHSTRVAD